MKDEVSESFLATTVETRTRRGSSAGSGGSGPSGEQQPQQTSHSGRTSQLTGGAPSGCRA